VTAAAFDELARRGVEVPVIEAGLGGRHDATNVLQAPICVLTSVGLEHTRWLGPTVRDIAREKLAVVGGRDGVTTLVLGDVPPEAEEEALATGATIVRGLDTGVTLPGYQTRNFALAAAAARAQLGALDADKVAAAAAHAQVPGRLQVVGEAPLTVLDGAHNPSGVAALVETLDGVVGDRPLVAVVSVLDDKDAASMLRELLGRCAALVCTRSANPRALPAATLASLAGQLGGVGGDGPVEVVAAPRAAVERARELAGPDGAVLATGSIYLVADLIRPEGARRVSAL
jgi:dihydrofolate synthase / folylpolyglutamate synthase